jgi:type IV pilus assembly protein PilF
MSDLNFCSLRPIKCLALLTMLIVGCASLKGPKSKEDSFKAQAFYEAGLSMIEDRRYPDAISNFETAHQLDPSRIDVVNAWSVASMEAGHLGTAEEILLKSLKDNPGEPTILNNLSAVYTRNQQPEKGVIYARKAIEVPTYGSPELAWANLGRAQIDTGDLQGAQTSIERARDLAPRNCSIRVLLTKALVKRGKVGDAHREIRIAANECSSQAMVHIWEAYVHYEARDLQRARKKLRFIVQRFERGPIVEFALKALESLENSGTVNEPPL